MPSYTNVLLGQQEARALFELDDEARDAVDEIFRWVYDSLAADGCGWREQPDAPAREPMIGCEPVFAPHWMVLLQRAYALLQAGQPVTSISSAPTPDELAAHLWPLDAVLVDQETLAEDADGVRLDLALQLTSHLVTVSPEVGMYVPVRFRTAFGHDEVRYVENPGSDLVRETIFEVGSSHSLLTELVTVAPAIGIDLDRDGTLPAAEARAVQATPVDHPFPLERSVWLSLYSHAAASVRDDLAVLLR